MKETSLPRELGGAISAIYIGARISDAPTPMPPSILKNKKAKKSLANADPIALTAKTRAQYFNINLLPNRSLSGPENIIANAATMVSELTEKPS